MDTALYMVVENHTAPAQDDRVRLHRRRGPAEMHQMTMTKMMMVMTPVSQVSIPARGQDEL